MKRKWFSRIIVFVLLLFISIIIPSQYVFATSSNESEIEYHPDVLDPESQIEKVKETLSSTTTYASGINHYYNFRSSYFDNLTYNLGMNYKGSCGYVALGMLLSYYDTYLSDNIIPEQYDVTSNGTSTNMIIRRNSPGIQKDIICDPVNNSDAYNYANRLNAIEYYAAVLSMANHSLHSKLITIGAARGYYNFSDNNNPCGTIYNERKNVLNDYLTDVIGMQENVDYQLVGMSGGELFPSLSNSVRNFTIQKILEGKPVVLSIGKGDSGHVVIAYDYDASTDSIYCHMGWGANETRITPESEGFTRYKTALTIDWLDKDHQHSDNYGVFHISSGMPVVQYYCYDSPTIITHHLNKTFLLRPQDYGFEPQYFFYEKIHTINFPEFCIETNRLRTGYIENQYINLSARRQNAGIAYLEYKFNFPIDCIMVNLSLWSNSEIIDLTDSNIFFQYKRNNNWVTQEDLLRNVNLSTDRENQGTYMFNLPDGTTEFRFYVETSPVGTRNKGRLSIGNMYIYFT